MPKLELPSGKWVEYRTDLMAEDEFAVQESFNVTIDGDGTRTMPGGITSIMRRALMTQVITAWGGTGLDGIPVPSVNIAGTGILGKVLTSKDYNALAEAIQPLLDEVVPAPNPQPAAPTPSPSS